MHMRRPVKAAAHQKKGQRSCPHHPYQCSHRPHKRATTTPQHLARNPRLHPSEDAPAENTAVPSPARSNTHPAHRLRSARPLRTSAAAGRWRAPRAFHVVVSARSYRVSVRHAYAAARKSCSTPKERSAQLPHYPHECSHRPHKRSTTTPQHLARNPHLHPSEDAPAENTAVPSPGRSPTRAAHRPRSARSFKPSAAG